MKSNLKNHHPYSASLIVGIFLLSVLLILPTISQPAAATEGEPVLDFPIVEDFNSGEAAHWVPGQGSWSVTNGCYEQTAESGESSSILTPTMTIMPYSYIVEVRYLMRGPDNACGKVKLFLNAYRPETNRVEILDGPEAYTLLLNTESSSYIGSMTYADIQPDTWYRLKVAVTPGRIQVYHAGPGEAYESRLVADGGNLVIPHGPIGLGTANCRAQFDAVFVRRHFQYGMNYPWLADFPTTDFWGWEWKHGDENAFRTIVEQDFQIMHAMGVRYVRWTLDVECGAFITVGEGGPDGFYETALLRLQWVLGDLCPRYNMHLVPTILGHRFGYTDIPFYKDKFNNDPNWRAALAYWGGQLAAEFPSNEYSYLYAWDVWGEPWGNIANWPGVAQLDYSKFRLFLSQLAVELRGNDPFCQITMGVCEGALDAPDTWDLSVLDFINVHVYNYQGELNSNWGNLGKPLVLGECGADSDCEVPIPEEQESALQKFLDNALEKDYMGIWPWCLLGSEAPGAGDGGAFIENGALEQARDDPTNDLYWRERARLYRDFIDEHAFDSALDTDGDRLRDDDEANIYGTDPLKYDTDEDGMPDGWEVSYALDPVDDNDWDDNPDGDAFSNLAEFVYGGSPHSPDTDGDGLLDHLETPQGYPWYGYGTHPAKSDTDEDGMPDGWEVSYALNPVDDNDWDDNPDDDAFSNLAEFVYGTNPHNADTDGDGLLDHLEMPPGVPWWGYGTSPTNPDTDGDRLPDGVEISHGTDPLTSDPFLILQFDEGPGNTIAQDSSGNDYDGTLGNGASYQPNWVVSGGDYALDFERTEADFVALGDKDAFSFADTNGDGKDEPFSASCWLKLESVTSSYQRHSFMSKWHNFGAQEWMNYLMINNNQAKWAVVLEDGDSDHIGKTVAYGTIEAGIWYHLVFTYNGSETSDGITLYINGIEASSATVFEAGTYDGMSNTAEPLYLGREGNGNHFDGLLDEVRLFSYELDAAEVQGLLSQFPALYLQFSESDSTSMIFDSSVHNHHGTRLGPSHVVNGFHSSLGTALAFQPAGADYVDFGEVHLLAGATTATWMAWVKPASLVSDYQIIACEDEGSGNNGWVFSLRDNYIHLLLSDSGSGWTIGAKAETQLQPGGWYHVAATWDGSVARWYVNGLPDGTDTMVCGPLQNTAASLRLGRNWHTSAYLFDGTIDEVRLYTRALSGNEIYRIVNFVGLELFLACNEPDTTSTLFDSSGYGHHGTRYGPSHVTNEYHAALGTALDFQPVGYDYVDFGEVDLLAGATAATWMAWVKPASLISDYQIIACEDGGSGNNGWVFSLRDNYIHLLLSDSGSGWTIGAKAETQLQPGSWYHVTATWDGSVVRWYVNGLPDGTDTMVCGSLQNTAASLRLGRNWHASAYLFDGVMDNVKIYSRILSAAEISAEAN